MKDTGTNIRFMEQALSLAWHAKGLTFPNPAVGALVVRKGKIVGSGATAAYGGPHAEKTAIKKAGKLARGATLYVTLEPCGHFGRTPPCTDAIIAAGIKKVVVAARDPNPLVCGKGIRFLKKYGIEVVCGIGENEATSINEDFFWSITHKAPWITLKLAMTLDGRIADDRGDSKWITNNASRVMVHTLRGRHASIAVGMNTLLHDNPHLTVRHGLSAGTPARIVFSSGAKPTAASYFVRHAKQIRSIVVVAQAGKQRIETRSGGVEFWFTGQRDFSKSFRFFLQRAYNEGLTSIFFEGGQRLASFLMEEKLVNRLYLFYGNKIIGNGLGGLLFRRGLPIGKAFRLTSTDVLTFGDDLMITGIPKWR
jgi:diaminohydroxyphosphoribosylaminopyrimidine deaminase / 5-amino-6-(5-phosphoribosylamino)uracil reductase